MQVINNCNLISMTNVTGSRIFPRFCNCMFVMTHQRRTALYHVDLNRAGSISAYMTLFEWNFPQWIKQWIGLTTQVDEDFKFQLCRVTFSVKLPYMKILDYYSLLLKFVLSQLVESNFLYKLIMNMKHVYTVFTTVISWPYYCFAT